MCVWGVCVWRWSGDFCLGADMFGLPLLRLNIVACSRRAYILARRRGVWCGVVRGWGVSRDPKKIDMYTLILNDPLQDDDKSQLEPDRHVGVGLDNMTTLNTMRKISKQLVEVVSSTLT